MIITDIIRRLRYKSNLGFTTSLLLHKLYIYINYRIVSDSYFLKRNFLKKVGRVLDLEQPRTMTEKIQWYKVNFKIPLIQTCSDKYAVREYVSEIIGEKYLVPLVFHTVDHKEIIPENLPDYPLVIKASHTSGTTHFINDKAELNWDVIRTDCKWWLNLNYYHMDKEWQYENIKPRIVVEKMLTDDDGGIPADYKLHCFEGKFEFLQVDSGRFGFHRRNIYDKDWNLTTFTFSMLDKNREPLTPNGAHVARPKHLDLLIALAEKLAKPFPYVRVDFYVIKEQIYFGELTFHHGGGYEQFTPDKWDLFYGNKIPIIKESS